MYNEYYKSWIPDVNVEKLKQNGFYKNIVADISDEDIIDAWNSQVYTLGVQTYNKTGYLEFCTCEGCLAHSQYNYNLLTLATVLKLFLVQRGGDGSLSLTGQITFAEAAVLKTGMSKDWDGGYNSSQYGSPYYNLSTLTKELMVIVNKNVTRTRFSNIKSNQMSIQCKRPAGTIFESDTLRVLQTDQKISFNLWLSADDMLKSEYLNIEYTAQGKPYLDFNAQSLLIFGSKTISIEPNQEGNLEASVIISPTAGNSLEAKENGLYASSSGVDFPITIEQGGTGKTNKEDALLALLPDTAGNDGKVLGIIDGAVAWVSKGGGSTAIESDTLEVVESAVSTAINLLINEAEFQFTNKKLNLSDIVKNAIANMSNPYNSSNGIDISDIDPKTGKRTISTKVNPAEFRYNDNGVIELSDQVTNDLALANTAIQTVNNVPGDENHNVDVAGSQPVLVLVSDFEDELNNPNDPTNTIYKWLLDQPGQYADLYFSCNARNNNEQPVTEIKIEVSASWASTTWESFCAFINGNIQSKYDGIPYFKVEYDTKKNRLTASTNDILNPIKYYNPSNPNTSLNTRLKLTQATGAEIVAKQYATIEQVNAIVNNAVTPLQQDIKLLNLDMFFADFYIGISINYLLSGKWDGDETQTYNEILLKLDDINTLTFTLADDVNQYTCPLTITKQQYINFGTLDNFTDYISAQMKEEHKVDNFVIKFKELGSQGFLISNLDSNMGVLVCEQDNNNLAVIMRLTDLTFAQNSIYTEFSDNSLQNQIDTINVKLNDNDTINKANSALQKINVNTAQGLSISDKVNNEQTISIQNASKTQKGVVQVGSGIEVDSNGVISMQGSSNSNINNPIGMVTKYWNYQGEITAIYDKSIIPSVSEIVFNAPFPEKSIFIAIEIMPPAVDTYTIKPAVIKTGTFVDIIQKTDFNVLKSGSIAIANVQNYYANSPSLAGKTIVLQFINNDSSNSVEVVIESSDIQSLASIASKIQSVVRSATNIDLKYFTCNVVNDMLLMNSNNPNALILLPYHTTGYELTRVLKLLTVEGARVIHDYLYVTQFEVNRDDFVDGSNNVANKYTQIGIDPSISVVQIDTSYISFKADLSIIAKNNSIADYNRLLIEFKASDYVEAIVNNPNQYYNRVATSHGLTGTKLWKITNNLLPCGVSYSPQVRMEYNNDEINASADKKLYAVFDFASYPFSVSEFEMMCNAVYKQVIAPIASYGLFIKIIVKNQYTNGKYTINGGKDDLIVSLGQITSNMWQNGVIENKFSIRCDNNNIVTENFAENKMIQGGIVMNTGLGQGQINLGLGRLAQWDFGSKAISPNPNQLDGVKFDADSNDLIITGGKILQLSVKGTFSLSNRFSNNNTRLKFGLVNPVDTNDFFSVDIPYKNEADIIQAIDNISFEADMTYFSNEKAFKVIPFSEDVDGNVNFVVQDFLSLYLKY